MRRVIPLVENAHDRDRFRVRRPDGKIRPFPTFHCDQVGSQFLIKPEVLPLLEKKNIMLGNQAHIVVNIDCTVPVVFQHHAPSHHAIVRRRGYRSAPRRIHLYSK
jgi:hypothetical protein